MGIQQSLHLEIFSFNQHLWLTKAVQACTVEIDIKAYYSPVCLKFCFYHMTDTDNTNQLFFLQTIT